MTAAAQVISKSSDQNETGYARTLFLSFTATIRQIASGVISETELDAGLFQFACMRDHAIAPGASGEADERNWVKGGKEAHAKLLPALLRAEADGRANWYRPELGVRLDRLAMLNGMLEQSGFPAIIREDEYSEFSYRAVAEQVEKNGFPLKLVF